MATELYQRVIAFDHGDASRNDVVRKVWDGTPWMIDVFTGKCGDELDRDMREWCMKNLGPEASPIHGQDGEWQRGYATINGWTWFGFKTEDQMMRFIERFPSTNKGDGGAPRSSDRFPKEECYDQDTPD